MIRPCLTDEGLVDGRDAVSLGTAYLTLLVTLSRGVVFVRFAAFTRSN